MISILSIVVAFISSASVVNGLPDTYIKVLLENPVQSAHESLRGGIHYPFKFYTRDDWNAKSPEDQVRLETPVPYVVIHHTYIPSFCNTTEKCKRDMRSMQDYHNSLGWGDIGYNFCIGSESGVYEGRGWTVKGIHAGKANGVSIGICLIGDWRTELPPKGQLEATKQLIELGVNKGFIRSDYKLVGHKQVMATECPGGALFEHISKWDHFVPDFE